MATKKNRNLHALGWCVILGSSVFPVCVSAGEAQFFNIFDKSKMEMRVPGTFIYKPQGRNIGMEAWLIEGETKSKGREGKPHNHPEEHIAIQMRGDTTDYQVYLSDNTTSKHVGSAGTVMHIPPGQQHWGEHGKEDTYMMTVWTPPRLTFTTSLDTPALGVESLDNYDTFDFNSTKLTVLKKKWVYARKGKLGAGLGSEALLIKKAAKKDYLVSARKASAEEVAIVYAGHVKVTGCGETRDLNPGDVFYCPDSVLTYSGLGKDDARVLRVFSPADSDLFVSK